MDKVVFANPLNCRAIANAASGILLLSTISYINPHSYASIISILLFNSARIAALELPTNRVNNSTPPSAATPPYCVSGNQNHVPGLAILKSQLKAIDAADPITGPVNAATNTSLFPAGRRPPRGWSLPGFCPATWLFWPSSDTRHRGRYKHPGR